MGPERRIAAWDAPGAPPSGPACQGNVTGRGEEGREQARRAPGASLSIPACQGNVTVGGEEGREQARRGCRQPLRGGWCRGRGAGNPSLPSELAQLGHGDGPWRRACPPERGRPGEASGGSAVRASAVGFFFFVAVGRWQIEKKKERLRVLWSFIFLILSSREVIFNKYV